MVRIAVAFVLGLTGCSAFFGLDSPALISDAAPGDTALDAATDAVDGALDAPSPGACPNNYAAIGGGRYRASSQNLPWASAALDCADDAASGSKHTHLIVLDDMTELGEANTLLGNDSWIGLSDRVTEGTFLWVTAQNTGSFPPASGTPWEAGSPGGPGASVDDCVLLRGNGTLSEAPCGNNRRYVCECDDYANDPTRY